MTNHLHHEDGAFQQFVALDGDNLTVLPDDIDPVEIGPVLCAGITAYKVGRDLTFQTLATCCGPELRSESAKQCVKACDVNPGEWIVVIGAAGGMG